MATIYWMWNSRTFLGLFRKFQANPLPSQWNKNLNDLHIFFKNQFNNTHTILTNFRRSICFWKKIKPSESWFLFYNSHTKIFNKQLIFINFGSKERGFFRAWNLFPNSRTFQDFQAPWLPWLWLSLFIKIINKLII